MILHIPHSSHEIPEDLRDQFVISDDELLAELALMTDAFTDEIFGLAGAKVLRSPISRVVVDVERFPKDAQEPMSKVGMGMIYTRTASGGDLRRALRPEETESLVSLYYETHHQALLREVETELATYGNAVIVDCHSFPSRPLPCDADQSLHRPQFCVGTDPFHTPKALAQTAVTELRKMGYSVQANRPYEGTLVPLAFWKKDRRVASIMIEVNRCLYMDETTGQKTSAFVSLKEQIRRILSAIEEFQRLAQPDVAGGW